MIAFLKRNYFLVLLIFIGFLLRFMHLSWGAPFFFHPDERNIASSVSQLVFPTHMNPNFFAYGSVPLYIIFFSGLLLQGFLVNHISFDQAIIISRFYSAIFSLLLIPLMFFIGNKLKDITTGTTAAVLTTFSIGFIQFAHFGTFEMWLTFLTTLLFLSCLLLNEHFSLRRILFCTLIMGFLIGTKISSVLLLPLPISIMFLPIIRKKHKLLSFERFFIFLLIFFFGSILFFFITNPFSFVDHAAFLNSFHYESSVALGTTTVFYTNEFFHTIPIVFQFLYVYPFLLNIVNTGLFILCFFYLSYTWFTKKSFAVFLIFFFFLETFLSQAFLFVKWTRYVVPTLPFMYLSLGIFFSYVLERKHVWKKNIGLGIIFISVFYSTILATAYTLEVFGRDDTRIYTASMISKIIPSNAPILSEIYDLGIISFNPFFPKITLFNFYDLSAISLSDLTDKLHTTSYIILPSQRILKVRLFNGKDYPFGNIFYSKLLSGELGFTKIYETPCDFLCNMVYLGSPVFSFEETATVFDRPEIMIFKKNDNFSRVQYMQLLTP